MRWCRITLCVVWVDRVKKREKRANQDPEQPEGVGGGRRDHPGMHMNRRNEEHRSVRRRSRKKEEKRSSG